MNIWPGIAFWYPNDGDPGKWVYIGSGWKMWVHSTTPDDYYTKSGGSPAEAGKKA